ncbi:MAG: hypothetical protein ACE5F9_14525 [Phycisphaerae bacterium]
MTSGQTLSTSRPKRSRWARWYVRVPAKWAVLLLVTFFVLFPDPVRFARHVRHLSDMQAMIQPEAPELSAWAAELQAGIVGESPRPKQAQAAVQKFVYDKVAYAWDWDVWGSADYLPTVHEMFARAAASGDGQIREDCDGRAVMAASLMRKLGYDARIVTDLRHVWVQTPQGDWMGPGRKKSIVSTARGNRLNARTLASNIPVSLSYGIAVFPLLRELIILATAFVLVLHRRMSWRAAALSALLLVQGLFFMRLGVLAPGGVSFDGSSWAAMIGIAHVVGGFAIVLIASARARRRSSQRRSSEAGS